MASAPLPIEPPVSRPLVDRHGRAIRYLRVSVTDRCDLRCRYCMAETMTFLPRDALLTFDELAAIAEHFVARGVRKIRLTGGEPLVRRECLALVARLGRMIGPREQGGGLDELTLTTNGTRLADHAVALVAAGVRRVNVSLDSREPDVFRHITRHGDVGAVLVGIDAAQAAGLRVKINMVALRGLNEGEIPAMLDWASGRGIDVTLIETMPVGAVEEDRADRFVPLAGLVAKLRERFALVPDLHDSGGPARYWRVGDTGTRLGLITPLSGNFCMGCNRVRLTSEGRLHGCLGHDRHVDLRAAIRGGGMAAVDAAIDAALDAKPLGHDFDVTRGAAPAVARHMNATGG